MKLYFFTLALAAVAQAAQVVIQNFAYSPGTLTISSGDTVTWINNDQVAHTVTSSSNAFDSGSVGPGESFSYAFTTQGTFQYLCTIHPRMTGTVIVT
ncbi:copper binding protein, plastocyanin/azurin family [Martensiomyces pterosporus]|nr:copper binding protein, plastocyanin/azurin family [Martensiomyces pterosporus]